MHSCPDPPSSYAGSPHEEEPARAPAQSPVEALVGAVARIAATGTYAPHPWQVAQTLLRAATAWVPGCGAAAIVVGRTSNAPAVRVVSSGDPLADEVADDVGRLALGPWPSAGDGPHLVRLGEDRSAGDRARPHPVAPLAEVLLPGACSALGVRLDQPGAASGRTAALVLVGAAPSAFDPAAQDLALLASYAAVVVPASVEVEQLREALDSRDRISTAKGMLMVRYGLDEPRAFALLVRLSRDGNTKLADVADRVVAAQEVTGA